MNMEGAKSLKLVKLCEMLNYSTSLLFVSIIVFLSIPQTHVPASGTVTVGSIWLTTPELKSVDSAIQDQVSVGNQVFISTMLANMYAEQTQRFLVFIEVRDSDGASRQISWVSSVVKGDGLIEITASWVPDRAGTYDLRTFALSDFENLEVLSSVASRQFVITDN